MVSYICRFNALSPVLNKYLVYAQKTDRNLFAFSQTPTLQYDRTKTAGKALMADSIEAQNGLSPTEIVEIPDKDTSKQLALLDDLKAQATLKYSVKDYDVAAELYSQATELQAELNGEMSAQNADLLYAYGRCLYHFAVKNSDVLGSKVAGEKQEGGPGRSKGKKAAKQSGTASS